MNTSHDTSMLLLRFSNDGGFVYYNEDEPRETAFLNHDILPGRKLEECDGGPKFNCDPMSTLGDVERNCKDKDCASARWIDGCASCMCYNNGNALWCDGIQSDYYDNYYKKNGKNPFSNYYWNSRKCNTHFSQQDVSCEWDWECESGLGCCPDKPGYSDARSCQRLFHNSCYEN